MTRKKSWIEKRCSGKRPFKKRIDKPFAGIPAGALMYISTPEEIDSYLKQTSPGQVILPSAMREELAQAGGAEYTCPVSTGIFLRIVAEAACEEQHNGRALDEIAPFWRIIDPDSDLAGKLSCGADFIRTRREAELSAS